MASAAAPLDSHRQGYTGVGLTAELPAVWRGRHLVNACFPSFDYLRGLQKREILQPQARGFSLPMAVLPRLYDLIGLANVTADNGDWVLQRNAWDRRVK